jgi:riboflavin-specific deaminase-like protein
VSRGVPAWWRAALAMADARRTGRPPPAGWLAPPAGEGELFRLVEPLLRRTAGSPPFVIAHLGQSLDGFIATTGGDSRFVTGPQDLDHMHRLRALSDAVVVGAGTVAADDPQLTTRRVSGPHAVRVVLDPMMRAPARARVLQSHEAPTLWLCDRDWHDPVRAASVAARVIAVRGLLAADGCFDASVAVQALVAEGLRVLFVEGGGVTVSRFLECGQLDRLHLALAPVLIGEGRRGVRWPAGRTMADCLRLAPGGRAVPLGDDVLWDFELRRSGAGSPESTQSMPAAN